jgi:hypothetical protein
VGLKLRSSRSLISSDDAFGFHDAIIVESDSLLIEPALEKAVLATANELGGILPWRFLAYLANGINKNPPPGASPETIIPYSTVVAVDPESSWMALHRGDSNVSLRDGRSCSTLGL